MADGAAIRWAALPDGPIRLELEDGRTLRLLTVAQMEEVRRTGGGDPLETNRALVALALEKDGRPVGPDEAAAMDDGELEELACRWAEFDRRVNPGLEEREQVLEEGAAALAAAPYARLRWRVLRELGVLPGEARAAAMYGRDYLWCALHMLIDRREELDALCPTCRKEREAHRCPVCGGTTSPAAGSANSSFDWERYERMKGGEAL